MKRRLLVTALRLARLDENVSSSHVFIIKGDLRMQRRTPTEESTLKISRYPKKHNEYL